MGDGASGLLDSTRPMTTAATAPGRRFRFFGYFLWVLPLVGVCVMVAPTLRGGLAP